ncbi:MAG: geranylgeranyl diphosphate synthase, type [Solirubrobacteraceae bacterium]|nr:geranylgeranyl diphosphate synthase, type [Solirubrobacteraceae bacterium]
MDTVTAARQPHEVLSWGRDVLDPALRAAVGTLPGAVRNVAEFHLGWCDADGAPASASGGKAIRPTLTLLAAEAAGGVSEAGLPGAVAVELVHNFSLLHDDVMDEDVLRRHRPTAWSVFGVGPAILAGDALLTLAFDTLAAGGGERARDGVRMLSATVQDLVDGQSADLAFEERDDVSLAECLSMARAKTGSLLGCACGLGELFATGDRTRIEHMRMFGERLGIAFQLVDDVLGIWGDPALTGKAIHSDISARKKSLPVVAALTSDTGPGRELALLYASSEPLSAADVASAAALVTASGGRAWSEAEAARQLAGALDDLRRAAASGRAAAELEALARLVTTRDR